MPGAYRRFSTDVFRDMCSVIQRVIVSSAGTVHLKFGRTF